MASEQRPAAPPASAAPTSAPARDSLLAFADSVLARPAAPAAAAEVQPYVTFFLRREEFGLPILRSREIVRVSEITRIPEAPPHVCGVLNLRGRVVPIVEIRTRLGLDAAPLTPQSRVIMVEAHDRLFGLLVDRVSRIAKIPVAAIKPAPAEALSANTDYVTGIAQMGAELIIILDVDKVLLLNPTAPPPTGANSEPRG
ncbi:MAG: chemotaxis protein CheW [Polyangia bacterium]|jgi:purine-binding chemotaxis protein CheW